jgi:hypothetical protein
MILQYSNPQGSCQHRRAGPPPVKHPYGGHSSPVVLPLDRRRQGSGPARHGHRVAALPSRLFGSRGMPRTGCGGRRTHRRHGPLPRFKGDAVNENETRDSPDACNRPIGGYIWTSFVGSGAINLFRPTHQEWTGSDYKRNGHIYSSALFSLQKNKLQLS